MAGPEVHRPAHRISIAIVLMLLLQAISSVPVRAAEWPGPPTNVTVAAGDETIVLSWLAPVDEGDSPITDYLYAWYAFGVVVLQKEVGGPQTSITLVGIDQYVANDTPYVFSVRAGNDAGLGGDSEQSVEVWPREGAVLPQTALTAIPAGGGSASTDPGGTGPTPDDPVTTTVSVPSSAGSSVLSIAETTPSEAPAGFVFLGQEVVISSTAATGTASPLRIVFRVDPSFAPVTIFRNGVPVEVGCDPVATATPSPCIAAGAGTSEITVLTAAASVWNIGLEAYAFDGFRSPVDRSPVVNSVKAGSTIPVRFGLGGNRGLNVLAPGYPKSQAVVCDAGNPVDAIEETVASSTTALTFNSGTASYQYNWKSDRAWAGICCQFVSRFRDGTEARATFAFRVTYT